MVTTLPSTPLTLPPLPLKPPRLLKPRTKTLTTTASQTPPQALCHRSRWTTLCSAQSTTNILPHCEITTLTAPTAKATLRHKRTRLKQRKTSLSATKSGLTTTAVAAVHKMPTNKAQKATPMARPKMQPAPMRPRPMQTSQSHTSTEAADVLTRAKERATHNVLQ